MAYVEIVNWPGYGRIVAVNTISGMDLYISMGRLFSGQLALYVVLGYLTIRQDVYEFQILPSCYYSYHRSSKLSPKNSKQSALPKHLNEVQYLVQVYWVP